MDKKLYAGSGNRYFNMYSLLTSQAIFDGFRRDYPDKRLFVLTRSSFAGQQRVMAALWSGDTTTYGIFLLLIFSINWRKNVFFFFTFSILFNSGGTKF